MTTWEENGYINLRVGDGIRTFILCSHCGGQGWEPDKPWKGEHRNWFTCHACGNPGGLEMPDRVPTEDDWERRWTP